ncbi:GMC oxidoreductase [Nocardia salmonicida]|uniref:GMC oxidoreductase n=1 Tax=Nocardia salmonicida TaxID=53431 RepID=UPI00371C9F88
MRRRSFLAAASMVGAAAVLRPAPAAAQDTEQHDTVVVGSGYGGAVAALRLAEAGHTALVLERGRRWPITPDGDTFATARTLDDRAFWVPSPGAGVLSTGVLQAFPAEGIVGLLGAGVGGGSLVNNAVMAAPDAEGFARSFGTALDYDEMAEIWYPRARALLGVSPIPDDVLASPAYANAREFADLAERAGFTPHRLDLAVDWDIVRAEIAGTAPASTILGDSMWGIGSGAKRSVDRTVLARAEATGLVQVRPLSRVDRIVRTDSGYLLEYTTLNVAGAAVVTRTVQARRVILAAGSIGSTALLVRAQADGGLPDLNSEVGRRWGTGGDHLVALTGWPPPGAAQGGPAHLGFTDDTGDLPMTMLSFPFVGQLAGGLLAVSDPPAAGTVRANGAGGVTVSWPQTATLARYSTAVHDTAARLAAARIGTGVAASGAPSTSHSLGGTVIGSATNDFGQVHGCPDLFVVDSALLPGSCGSMPPALTVTAVADRCLHSIIAGINP